MGGGAGQGTLRITSKQAVTKQEFLSVSWLGLFHTAKFKSKFMRQTFK